MIGLRESFCRYAANIARLKSRVPINFAINPSPRPQIRIGGAPRADVRFGSLADIEWRLVMSALPPKADVRGVGVDVR
jgi:hypothetical protein